MTIAFGIDLGTTNSVISRLVGGRPVPIPIDGSPIVPSVVLFDGERIAVGREARNLELQYPERTIRSAKRKMGQDYRYRLEGREVSPEQVSAEVLRALKLGAEAQTGEAVRDVVITVPAWFDDIQRRATLKAGELAGLNVLRLLNEPTSAALIYEQAGSGETADGPEYILIYDLGGGTFDVSVLEVFQGVREVRATAGNTALGGDDFDERLTRLFLEELQRGQAYDPREDVRAMARLRRVAEDTKIRLSTDTRVLVREEFLATHQGKAIHLELEVERRRLEELIQPLIESTLSLCRRALADARLDASQLARVCLVGGSTRIPLVRELLEEAFGAELHQEIDPDLAVGLGAAMQAGLLQGSPVERILVDVAAHSLGIRVRGPEDDELGEPDTFAPIIRRNTVLPSLQAEEFYTLHDRQQRIQVEVFQGEALRASDNVPVGTFNFPLEPVPADSPVKVEFAYDLNGVVKASVSQPGTANAKTVALSVADAGRSAQEVRASSEGGTVERKARALLASGLADEARARLGGLLSTLVEAGGPGREAAEEALLDFFLEYEGAPGREG